MIPIARKFTRTNAISASTYGAELSPLAVEQGILLNADGSLGCGFRLDAPYTPTQSDEAVGGLFAQLGGFLNALPECFDLQVIWTQHSRHREFEARLSAAPLSSGLVGEVQGELQENLLEMLREQRLRWIEVYFLLVRKRPADGTRTTGWRDFFGGAARTFRHTRETYEAAAAELLRQARNLGLFFTTAGWKPIALGDQEIIRLFFQRWNPRQFESGADPAPPRDSGHPLIERFAHSSFSWNDSGFAELDGWQHAILTLYEPPEELGRPAFDDLLLLAGLDRAEMVVNIERGDATRRMKRLKTLLRQRQSDPRTAEDPAEKSATEQLSRELEEMGARSEAIWRAACYLHLWAPARDALQDSVAAALALGRSRDAVFIHERRALWPYWRAMQPFWTQDKDRYRLLDYSTRQLVRLLPLFGQPNNLEAGKAIGAIYQTASRSLFNWIVPDEAQFANPHHLIVGGTGSGKSVLQDENLIAMRRRGAKAIIVDLGGSFANFCTASGGVYVDYDIRSRANRLNPLGMPPGATPDPEQLRSRALWIECLVMERGRRLSTDELVLVEQALRRAYFRDPDQAVYLRHVRAALLQDPASAGLAHRLALWCDDGSFANLFDGPSQIELSAPVLVFDLKRVLSDQRDPDLARVIFNSIVGAVAALSLQGSAEPKFLTFDEAGIMLKDEATAEFMEYCFRTLRKTGVCVGAISQSLEDFLRQEKARNAFVGAADNLFVLKQDNYDKARLIADELGLGAEALRRIQSLVTAPGSHAEFLLIQKTTQGQRSLHLLSASTPLKYAFTANSPEDRRVLSAYQAEGLSRPDAIRKFSRLHPRGILSAAAATLALIAVGWFTGCAEPPPPPPPSTVGADEARRDERLKLMQQTWAQQVARPLPGQGPAAPQPVPVPPALVAYPAGCYDGLWFAPRTAADPQLSDPPR
jgi:hypothetical protein